MNSNITMTVSGFTRTNENKAVYVMFTEQDTIYAEAKKVNPFTAMMK